MEHQIGRLTLDSRLKVSPKADGNWAEKTNKELVGSVIGSKPQSLTHRIRLVVIGLGK
jgi:hypothetical protein